MGPLVPDVIGNELNFIIAIFIGIAFGFVLEQAGFSTSKKLVGMFYGYDFTVLRVFFTAGVTAMIGVIALGHFGLLDLSLIYINPTFLWSALVGGVIMGLGFVIGGFCPGTSICAAAIGKIDAMFFVVGSFFGVLIFAEGYPIFEGLFNAANWGNPTFFSVIGVSQGMFAFLLTFVAVGAFWITTLIENKINGKPNPEFSSKPLYYSLTIVAVVIGLSAFVMPDRKEAMIAKVSNTDYVNSFNLKSMTPDELAFRIMYDDPQLQIFDLRDTKKFAALSLPRSTSVTIRNLFDKDTEKLLSIKHVKSVFISYDEAIEKQAAVIAINLGYKDVLFLEGGFKKFTSDILDYKAPGNLDEITNRWTLNTYRFRADASKQIPVLIKEFKEKQNKNVVKKEKKRVLGGC